MSQEVSFLRKKRKKKITKRENKTVLSIYRTPILIKAQWTHQIFKNTSEMIHSGLEMWNIHKLSFSLSFIKIHLQRDTFSNSEALLFSFLAVSSTCSTINYVKNVHKIKHIRQNSEEQLYFEVFAVLIFFSPLIDMSRSLIYSGEIERKINFNVHWSRRRMCTFICIKS